MVTRLKEEGAKALIEAFPQCVYHRRANLVSLGLPPVDGGEGLVLVVCAGTSDLPVAQEAWLTARSMGAKTELISDVGVAGLHRILNQIPRLREARAICVVAGMEGALPSVVGGLVDKPVIAVPTSVGYGAAFGGLAALFGHAQQLRLGSYRGEYRQRFRSRIRCRPDQPPARDKHTPIAQMTNRKPAALALENGVCLHGFSIGADGEKAGDLVFNTAMTGYHEILTDPSYAGQTVLMTYPLIGNYGVAEEDAESDRAWAEAFIIKELSSIPSNHRSDCSLDDWLKKQGVVAIEGVDTRKLTKIIREAGSLRCVVSTVDLDEASLVAKAQAATSTDGQDLTQLVTCKEAYPWDEAYPESYPTETPAVSSPRLKVVAVDFGTKRNILRSLIHTGFDVQVVPASTSAAQILAQKPDGVFLSNGPGDPAAVVGAIDMVSELVGQVPVFGICLGHQILSLALGAKTFKMPFGHHGANHPVRDETTRKVEITSQNHSYAVDPGSLPDTLEVTHLNLNDHTIAGLRHKKAPAFSVQYHPESAPGPLDSGHLFMRFRELILSAAQPS